MSSSSSQPSLLKLDSVLSAEQMRALLQEAATTPQHDKLDFDVLGNVGGPEDGTHSLAAIDDSFHDLENLVLDQNPASGSLFAETSEAEVEALLKATLGAEDFLSPIDLVLLDHCYCSPHRPLPPEAASCHEEPSAVAVAHAQPPPAEPPPPAAPPGFEGSSPHDEVDGDDGGLMSPDSPHLPLRRSQRQIERIDRERLERIKAENAEQKRREQEEMVGRRAPAPGAESPQAPPPATPPVMSPLASPVPATPPHVASPLQPQLPQQPPVVPVRASPAPPKEKSVPVVAPPQTSPVRRGKAHNSESTSSTEGGPEDGTSARVRKKRSHDEAEHGGEGGPKKGAPRNKAEGPKGAAAPRKEGPKKGGVARADEDAPPVAKEEAHPPARRKSDEVEAKKRKPSVEVVSPFGKVVKVVRTVQEPKKKPRRESFTDEPALFSQPDVLHKEHEPQTTAPSPLASAPASTPGPSPTTAPPVAMTATTPVVTDLHGKEASYDTVEAQVARLAGGLEHGFTPAHAPLPTASPAAATPTPAATAVPIATPVAQPPVIGAPHHHKPATAGHKLAEPRPTPPKKPALAKPAVTATPAVTAKPPQPEQKKPPLAIAIKSAPPPPPSPATKVKHASQQGPPPHKAAKPSKPSPKAVAKKPELHAQPKKAPKPEPPAVPQAAPPTVVVAERPKRQSKEKFKRAMMRKREMGRRVDDEDVEDSSEEPHDSDWSSEDDPERLWCICRKPHNDKFMIECDRCKDWFHGTCVGVTRQQGRLLEKENKEWVCPKCTGKGEIRFPAVAKKELHRVPSEEKAHHTAHTPKVHPAKAHQPKAHQPKPEEHSAANKPVQAAPAGPPRAVVRECLVCKQRAECVGIYCGRNCIAKYVNDATQTIKAAKLDGERRLMFTERSSGKLVAGVQTPTPENLTNWLVRNPTYELAVARTPARPAPVARPQQAAKPTPLQQPSKPAQQPSKPAQQPSKLAKQPTSAQAQPATPSTANTTPAVASSTTNSVPGEGKGSTTEAAPEAKKPEPPSIEPVRLNVRKVLRDALLNRCKEASEVSSLGSDEVRRMAVRIEEELFKYFRDTGTRYKSKYRSLVFNIKDSRNQGLFRKILRGKIPPDRLVRMTPEELASKELARWREQENKHAIEMIKKEQMEAAQNVSSHALLKKTHKGEVEIDDDNLRLLEKAEEKVLPEQPEVPTVSPRVPSVVSSSGGSAATSLEAAAERLGRDTTDGHRSHLFDLNCKICTGKMAPPPEESLTPSPPPSRRSSTAGMTPQPSGGGSLPTPAEELSSSSASSSASPPPPPPVRGRGGTPPPPSKKSRRPREDSSDLEPSSTVSIGSPDSSGKAAKQPQSVWKGFISMQDVSKFVTAAYKVSGPTDFLSQQDIPDTINVCGRIIPDQVWDYLSKIKQSGNKELLVVRFQPANEEERRPYRELYSYLNSRKRCGVVGGLSRMLKDFYILPLPAHSPVPTVLMPFDGPGLLSGRPHMLLGIIVRHKNRPKASTGKASKSSWSERSEALSMTPPLPETSSGAHSDDDEPYEPSYTPPLEKRPRQAHQATTGAVEGTPVADDEDVPYDPEENEVGIGTEPPPPPPPPRVSGQAVSELIERISAGANPAAVTTSVLASLASNADLEHQKRLLVELTHEVEEQKRMIELQRKQAVQLQAIGKPAASPPPPPLVAPPAAEASGIPFLDGSLPTDTGLSFLSNSSGCSLPSSLQELLNKVKVPAAIVSPAPPAPSVGAVLGSLLAPGTLPGTIGSPQHSPLATKKTLTEDPIVRHFAADSTPESDPEGGAGATPPPPGDSPPPALRLTAADAVAPMPVAAPTVSGVSRSPGTPTKDELVTEEAARPQDPRRRKAAASAPLAASSSPAAGTGSPQAAVATMPASTGSQLGAKSASELMEMARKQLEEMDVPPPAPQPPAVQQGTQVASASAVAAPPVGPPPVFATPPPGMPPSMPPPGLGPPPAGMYGPAPPPPVDPVFGPPGVVPPPGVPPGYPPPPGHLPPGHPQWADSYWKPPGAPLPPPGAPLPPPQAGWNGGRSEYRQHGWRGQGRRSQWDQHH